MEHAIWFLIVGFLLLSIGLTFPTIQRLPVTSSMIYLAVGILVGPTALDLFHINPLEQSELLEILTEVAVIISLFSAGVKMPVPVRLPEWQSPLQLAFVSMAITVGLTAVFGYYVLELPLGAAVLLGAVIAPTDPVLATEVQVRHPGDRDRLRFYLTSEAGMNDGSAFPFVMLGLGLLGLHDLGESGMRWLMFDLLWATSAGIAVGVVGGYLVAVVVRRQIRQLGAAGLLDDFLGIGLIGIVYGISILVDAWGFLAVFAAAVALRQTEHKLSGVAEKEEAELQTDTLGPEKPVARHRLSEATLIFKEHLERLSEVVLILLIGGTLFLDSWSWKAVLFSLFVFCVARPVSVVLGLAGTNTPWRVRYLIGWFGVRGIGSLYYLMYAIQQGITEETSLDLVHLVLIAVTLSIVLHGASVKPVVSRYWTKAHEESN